MFEVRSFGAAAVAGGVELGMSVRTVAEGWEEELGTSSELELYQKRIAASATNPPTRILGSSPTFIPNTLVVEALTVALS